MKKLWKKGLAVVLAGVAMMSFAGCSTGSGGSKEKKELTVAGVVFQEDQFMKLLQKGYQQAAEDNGVKCLVSNTNNDQGKETELINTYVSQKVDGIAISPINEETSIETLKLASDKGVEVAVCNTSLKDSDFIVGGYTSDNYLLGKQTGEVARKFIEEELGGKARVAVVQFKSQLPDQSTARMNGFVDQIKDLPGVEIIADQDAWLQDKAVQVVGDIITANEPKGGVDIVWAANDGGTIGAVMAVKNAGKAGETFVFGTDAAEQQIAMLRSDDNVLQVVTGQDPYEIGYKTMDLLVKGLKGEETNYEKGKEVIVEGIVLDRANPTGINDFEKNLKERMGN